MGQDRENRKSNLGRIVTPFETELKSDARIETFIGIKQIVISVVLLMLIFLRETYFPSDNFVFQKIRFIIDLIFQSLGF